MTSVGPRPNTETETTPMPEIRHPKIEIYPHAVAEGADPEWGWRLKAGNGEIVAHGEGYERERTAELMAVGIVVDHAYDDAVVVHLGPDGQVDEAKNRDLDHVTDGSPCWCGPEVVHVRFPALRTATVIPEALGSEDGDRWWAQGHVDPMAMVLAVLVEQATNYGPKEAGDMIVRPRLRARPASTPAENRAYVAQMVDQVVHYWCKPDPDNDERMLDCDADDPAAKPWTELAL